MRSEAVSRVELINARFAFEYENYNILEAAMAISTAVCRPINRVPTNDGRSGF